MGRSNSPELNDRLAVREGIVAAIPSLRAFALSLSGNVDRADDLVQETLVRALAHIDSFEPGTNLPAWLFTILRNYFRSEYLKRNREVEDHDGQFSGTLTSLPEQDGHLEFEELRDALARLPDDQREAIVLVGAAGVSYEEAARICGCAVRTVKSRAHRARQRLAELLGVETSSSFGFDRTGPSAYGARRPYAISLTRALSSNSLSTIPT
jgi:RNA polymerase sigma-70 factor (ECF subfamily)